MLKDENFRKWAGGRGVTPRFRPGQDADALEKLDLLMTIEELGDRLLLLEQSGQIDSDRANRLLDRLLKCYIEPVKQAREIVQIEAEIRVPTKL